MDFAVPDVERMASDGDRRVRRRRGAVVGGIAAAVALLSVTATQVAGAGHDRDSAPVVTHPDVVKKRELAWATGSVIHAGDRTIESGTRCTPSSRPRPGTSWPTRKARVWSVTDGRVDQVGTIDAKHPHLVVDPRGPLAAWMGTAGHSGEPDGISYVDQSRMSGGDATIALRHGPADVDALSGDTLYLHDDRGAVAHDLLTDEERVVDPAGHGETYEGLGVVAAHDGTLAMNAERGTLLGTSRDHAVLLEQAYGNIGSFSPDGAYFSGDADEPSVWTCAPVSGSLCRGWTATPSPAGSTGWTTTRWCSSPRRRRATRWCWSPARSPTGAAASRRRRSGALHHPDYELPVGQPIGDD